MKEALSWEATSFSASEQNLHIECKPETHCSIYNGPPFVSILDQTNQIYLFQNFSLKSILVSLSYLLKASVKVEYSVYLCFIVY
jgi:hypothetical protein